VSLVSDNPPSALAVKTLAESEKEHILKTLEKTGWRIKGPNGAATILGINPSTLYSRMQKLDIPHRQQKDSSTH
jgi:transcriptional regulator with GAF, ATPase, and Fis domain